MIISQPFWVVALKFSVFFFFFFFFFGILQGGHALWKTGKTGKMVKKSLQGKFREIEILLKIREKSGNFKKSFVRSKYSNFIAVQMWLLVVSCSQFENSSLHTHPLNT